MADVFSKKKRSAVMAAIKGRGNRSTELAVRGMLKKLGITGWRANFASIPGKPDFAFAKIKLAIFVDGCFWHGCKKCLRNRKPAENAAYWRNKIAGNVCRDKRINRKLNRNGWSVLRIWEHLIIKKHVAVESRILKAVRTQNAYKSGAKTKIVSGS